MFYSHEVLTSRKYGVATVWLVATLGSKSTLKKVTRKAILDVDVVKTCDTIVTPEAPMALRLQSNLLYGVTRVYAQQCGYVLSDAESARNSMKAVFKVLKASALDAEGGSKARADQLILQDDPNFFPELDLLPMDLDGGMDFAVRGDLQRSASLLSGQSSQHTVAHAQEIGGLVIPQSASSFAGGPVGAIDGFSSRGDSGPGVRLGSASFQRRGIEGVLEDDLGFMVDENGNMILEEDLPPAQPRGPLGRVGGSLAMGPPGGRLSSEGQQEQELPMQPDEDGFMILEDDDIPIGQDGEPQPAFLQHGDQQEHQSTTSETADAPMRRRQRTAHTLPLDAAMELHNGDLARWSRDYIQNMNEAIRHKQTGRLATIAKKNAEHWMLGAGLETLGQADRGPLDMFTGVKLLEAMTGMQFLPGGAKRTRNVAELDNPDPQAGRSVRPRGEPSSDEQGRGMELAADDGLMPVPDDYTIEQGRKEPTPLDDRHVSSLFPWNQSAGSHRPTGGFSAGATSALGAMSFGPLSRRNSRLTSASPLVGRGVPHDEDPGLQLSGSDGAYALTADDEFELFGPAAHVDTQTAAQSQWVRQVLDGESANFLEFVKAGIEARDLERGAALAGDEEIEGLDGSVEFETLLPPERNSCVVAAQGLLHVLTLGTRNAIEIEQEEPFGPLRLRVI